ncbi:MAG TPA: hypothetical protein VK641_10610 [Terriglobales bacterium]|nr:hypothetical protein [Terriglobales bacterium]
MPQYFILFLTHGDDVFGSHQFAAPDDTAAVTYAQAVYRSTIGRGYEIWRGVRHVHTEIY